MAPYITDRSANDELGFFYDAFHKDRWGQKLFQMLVSIIGTFFNFASYTCHGLRDDAHWVCGLFITAAFLCMSITVFVISLDEPASKDTPQSRRAFNDYKDQEKRYCYGAMATHIFAALAIWCHWLNKRRSAHLKIVAAILAAINTIIYLASAIIAKNQNPINVSKF